MEWLKAYRSKYKHLYTGESRAGAACGSPAIAWPYNSFEHIGNAPKCPKCLEIERITREKD